MKDRMSQMSSLDSDPITRCNDKPVAAPFSFRLTLSTFMKRLTFSLFAAALFLTPFTTMAADPAPYRHIVIFAFKAGTPPAKIEEIATAFKALSKSIPSVKSFEWGLNVSPEKLNPDLTHVFSAGFESKEALESGYLHHPEHVKFGALLGPHLAKVVVVDYVAQ